MHIFHLRLDSGKYNFVFFNRILSICPHVFFVSQQPSSRAAARPLWEQRSRSHNHDYIALMIIYSSGALLNGSMSPAMMPASAA